jgi:hypothetical protein
MTAAAAASAAAVIPAGAAASVSAPATPTTPGTAPAAATRAKPDLPCDAPHLGAQVRCIFKLGLQPVAVDQFGEVRRTSLQQLHHLLVSVYFLIVNG